MDQPLEERASPLANRLQFDMFAFRLPGRGVF